MEAKNKEIQLVEEEESFFVQGLPEMIGSNYAKPSDHFWQTEIQYNGFDSENISLTKSESR